DQIGNRARGERLVHLVGPRRGLVAAALVLTPPFVPLLFQGEGGGASTPFLYFTDHQDPDVARAVSGGPRREFAAFAWSRDQVADPQSPQTFERSKLDWAERERAPHDGFLDWHRRLIALRRLTPSLTDGRFGRVRYDEAARWLVIERGEVAIACNLGSHRRTLDVDGRRRLLL